MVQPKLSWVPLGPPVHLAACGPGLNLISRKILKIIYVVLLWKISVNNFQKSAPARCTKNLYRNFFLYYIKNLRFHNFLTFYIYRNFSEPKIVLIGLSPGLKSRCKGNTGYCLNDLAEEGLTKFKRKSWIFPFFCLVCYSLDSSPRKDTFSQWVAKLYDIAIFLFFYIQFMFLINTTVELSLWIC